MSNFTSVYPESKVLNPGKRVNYIHGLVLGVDEFKQEECYLLEKDRLHNRSLHGYGTVCGLRVSQQDVDAGLEIRVDPGIAVSPSGQVIQIPRTQCAILDEWLESHDTDIAGILGSPAAGSLSLYLMLCYKECETDLVPIPTGPCQSLEETTAASRVADSFSLSFELQAPPAEHFESAMQDLSQLLLNIPVQPGGAMTLDDIKDLVRALIPLGSPSASPPLLPSPSSPTLADAIAPENIEEFFNAAFLVWVTEVKPCLLTGTSECVPSDPYKNCVFLAQIDLDVVTIDGVTRIDTNVDVVINEQQRQFMLSSQAIQNYISPVSTWVKSLAGIALPGVIMPPAGGDVVTLSTNQSISGQKTFAAPLQLSGDGRVLKNIILPGHYAHHGRGAARGLFSNTVPALHFLTSGSNAFGGEGIFDIPIPEDLVFNSGFQFRLVWGFQGDPEPSPIAFDWRVGAIFYEENQSISGSSFEVVNVSVNEPTERRNDVLVTDFTNFDDDVVVNGNSLYGVMHISITDPGVAISEVYLLHVELRYTANRLGRRIAV